jgi:TusA-related sulfurtransferase
MMDWGGRLERRGWVATPATDWRGMEMKKQQMPKPGVTLNLCGVSCPGPILGAKKVLMELAEGEVMLLVSDCPATSDDLFSWAERTGNQVLGSEPMPEGATGYYVQRGRGETLEPSVRLDMRGSRCPGPIVQAKHVLIAMAEGEVLKLISDCPGARADVEGWARVTGVHLEKVVELGAHEWEFLIRKA